LIADEARRRGVTEIVHFTHQRALLGISFTKAVLPRNQLRREQILEYILEPNAKTRSDSPWFGHVNLSISDINHRFFQVASKKWHKELWWVVLAFDPEILDHDGAVFATTNNAYDLAVTRRSGLDGFKRLYDEPMAHGGLWSTHPASTTHLPACPQAELLYEGALSIDHLRRVYVRNADNYREACSFLTFLERDVPVEIDADRFEPPTVDLCENSS